MTNMVGSLCEAVQAGYLNLNGGICLDLNGEEMGHYDQLLAPRDTNPHNMTPLH